MNVEAMPVEAFNWFAWYMWVLYVLLAPPAIFAVCKYIGFWVEVFDL